jgi:hypothetical protein
MLVRNLHQPCGCCGTQFIQGRHAGQYLYRKVIATVSGVDSYSTVLVILYKNAPFMQALLPH